MPLSPGEKLGPYEILASIGKGGMGEVWRARDPRLGRDVAVKVSADQFSDRFEKEARSIAALNHPNICTLHDIGPNYLVMELIDGPTLADLILEGPIPLTDALAIARQIADALESAHEKGIVHRDLKPGNVKIRPDGSVKVLDFGLAKSVFGETQVTSDSPTLMQMPTQMGVILGTAAYMPPEQARGKPVDKRADIWSFGVVLYEMLTGHRLFQGEDLTETLAAVVKTDPDLSVVPPQVKRLLTKCLQKDPRNRLRDIGDAWGFLDDPAAPASAPAAPSRFAKLGWIAALGLAVVAAALGFLDWRAQQPTDRPLIRLDVDLGEDVSLPTPTPVLGSIAISPDGTRLSYQSGQPNRLFLRRLDQARAIELPGTQGVRFKQFFSPDGQWIGLASSLNWLNKISVEGGTMVPLGEVPTGAGADWAEDGSIFSSQAFTAGGGLWRLPPGGGPRESVLKFGPGDLVFASPQVLPGGKAILFATGRGGGVDNYAIEVVTLPDHRRKVVARGGQSARYLASAGGTSPNLGHLVYVNKSTLYAMPFDLNKLETRGPAVAVLDDVAYQAETNTGDFDFSPAPAGNGTLIYRRWTGPAAVQPRTLQWVYPSGGVAGGVAGRKEPLLAKPGSYFNPTLSPDGKHVAMAVSDASNRDIWVYDMQRETMTRLTFGEGYYESPVWTPDGQYVVFYAIGMGMFWARADGSGQPQLLTQSGSLQVPVSFTPDGRHLAYSMSQQQPQLWTLPLEEQGGRLKAGHPEQFLKSSFRDASPAFSPDGRWLAYQSDESGKDEIYVRAFPAPASAQGGRWQISGNGGTAPHWSKNGHELIYQSGDQLVSAGYAVKGDTFVAEKPRVWIEKPGATTASTTAPATVWDLSSDGKRALVLTPAQSATGSGAAPKPEHEIVMLQNFSDELRRKAPLGK